MAAQPKKAEDKARPIYVKRYKKVTGGHHGGAWKVAYADFVTAMMAFFMVMWLITAVSRSSARPSSTTSRIRAWNRARA